MFLIRYIDFNYKTRKYKSEEKVQVSLKHRSFDIQMADIIII